MLRWTAHQSSSFVCTAWKEYQWVDGKSVTLYRSLIWQHHSRRCWHPSAASESQFGDETKLSHHQSAAISNFIFLIYLWNEIEACVWGKMNVYGFLMICNAWFCTKFKISDMFQPHLKLQYLLGLPVYLCRCVIFAQTIVWILLSEAIMFAALLIFSTYSHA